MKFSHLLQVASPTTPLLPSSPSNRCNLGDFFQRKQRSLLGNTFTFLSSDLSVCSHLCLDGLRASPSFLLTRLTHHSVFWSPFLPSEGFLASQNFFLLLSSGTLLSVYKEAWPSSAWAHEPHSEHGPLFFSSKFLEGLKIAHSLTHHSVLKPLSSGLLMTSHWDTSSQSYHSLPSWLNFISLYSS